MTRKLLFLLGKFLTQLVVILYITSCNAQLTRKEKMTDMYCKICPHCKGKSFSAAKENKWICPYCKKDITKVLTEEEK